MTAYKEIEFLNEKKNNKGKHDLQPHYHIEVWWWLYVYVRQQWSKESITVTS